LNFAGSRFNGIATGSQVAIYPFAFVGSPELRVRSEYLHRVALGALIQFAPEDFLNRAFRSRYRRFAQFTDGAIAVQFEDFQFKVRLGNLLSGNRVLSEGTTVSHHSTRFLNQSIE